MRVFFYLDGVYMLKEVNNLKDLMRLVDEKVIQKMLLIVVSMFSLTIPIQLIKTMSFDEFPILTIYNPYNYTVDMINRMVFTLGLFILMIIFIKRYYEHEFQFMIDKTMIIFLILCLWIVLISMYHGFNDYVLNGQYYRNENLVCFLMYFLIYYYCASLLKKEYKRIVINILLIVFDILAILVFYAQFQLPGYIHFEIPYCGIFYNINHYGYCLTLVCLLSGVLVCFDNSKYKIFYFVTFLLHFIMLLLNNTFGCYLAVMGGLVFYSIVLFIINHRIDKRGILIILFSLFLTMVFYSTRFIPTNNFETLGNDVEKILTKEDAHHAGSGRWKLWTYSIETLNEKPERWLLGMGIEGISDQLNSECQIDRPHNEFLQYIIFFGIPGLLLYIAGIMSVFLNGLKHKKKLDIYTIACIVAAFGYLFSSFFGNTMAYTTPFFFIILGLSYYQENDCNNNYKVV